MLLLLALALRLVVPAGYMPDFSDGGIVISICTGEGPMRMTIKVPGMDHGRGDHAPAHDGKADQPCGFAALAMPGLAGADPIQLALALLFIVATALFARPPRIAGRGDRLRPPSQGPPLTA